MHFKNEEENFHVEMTSMADLVFLLLIFFMVSTSFVDFPKRMDIKLPESKASDKVEKNKVFTIEMGIEGRITLNGKDIALEGLEKALEAESKNAAQKSVIIKADKGIQYGKVVTVMGVAKTLNITDISIAVK